MLIQIVLRLFVLCCPTLGAVLVFTPATYSITVGTNTTTNVTLTTFVYADAVTPVTLATDGSGGTSYFGFSGDNLVLVNRLDVEYGGITWSFDVLANDTVGNTDTATVSVTTYQSTTTTTTTPVPPGYEWFDKTENKILFGGFAGITAIITGFCVMMCLRFHRLGTCLPKGCPAYSQCRGSCKRQCICCPLPCDFRPKKPKKVPLPKPPPPPPTPLPEPIPPEFYSLKKEDEMLETFMTSYEDKTAPLDDITPFDTEESDVITPRINAPIATGYGGNSRRKRWKIGGTVPAPAQLVHSSSLGRTNKLTKMAAGGRRSAGLVVPRTASSIGSYKHFDMGLDEIRSIGLKSSANGNASTTPRSGGALYPSMLPTRRE